MTHNRNRLVGGFEEIIERGQSTVKKSTKNSASDFANTTKNQITGGSSDNNQAQVKPDQGTNEAGVKAQDDSNTQMTDEERVKFLRDLYGSGNSDEEQIKEAQKDKKKKNSGDIKEALGVPEKDPHEGLTPEEIAKLEAARRQLHGDYYREFLEKAKSKEQPIREKNEQEEQEKKMEEIQTQENKNKNKSAALNPAIQKQGTAESAIGTMG